LFLGSANKNNTTGDYDATRVTISGFAMLTAMASAQSVTAQTQSTEIIDHEDGSSDVIVTVERRAQSLQDYAGTAATISGEELKMEKFQVSPLRIIREILRFLFAALGRRIILSLVTPQLLPI